jgi:hypothetical protein
LPGAATLMPPFFQNLSFSGFLVPRLRPGNAFPHGSGHACWQVPPVSVPWHGWGATHDPAVVSRHTWRPGASRTTLPGRSLGASRAATGSLHASERHFLAFPGAATPMPPFFQNLSFQVFSFPGSGLGMLFRMAPAMPAGRVPPCFCYLAQRGHHARSGCGFTSHVEDGASRTTLPGRSLGASRGTQQPSRFGALLSGFPWSRDTGPFRLDSRQ